ncbi:MAG: YdbH domain-containing protein [Thermodesulfobacteriota bacterium]|nr:YdbH domain-containing protein [Thermodesulfobacteriota bacterium]
MRIAKIAVSLLLVLSLTLLAVRFLLVDRLVAYGLQKAGAHGIIVNILDIGFKQIHIDVLGAAFKAASGETFSVKVHNISLQYNLQQLFSTGKCAQIDIEEMQIDRVQKSQGSRIKLHLPEQINLLKNRLRTQLPFEQITINQLLFHGDLPPQLSNKIIQLTADIKGTAISATVSMQAVADTKIMMDLQSPDSLHATATIVGQQQDAEIVQARLVLQPDGVSGKVDLHLRPVLDFLLQTVDMPGLPELNGSLNGTFSLPLPLHDTSTVQVEIAVQDTLGHQFHLNAAGNPNTQLASLTLTGQINELEILNTRLAVADQAVSGNYSFQISPLLDFLTPYMKISFPEITGLFTGNLDIPLLSDTEKNFLLTTEGTSLILPGFSGDSVRVQLVGGFADKAMVLERESWIHADTLRFGKSMIEKFSLDLAGKFRKRGDQVLLDFLSRQNLEITGLSTGNLHITNLHLKPEKPLQISIHNSSWSVVANTLHTTSPFLAAEGAWSCEAGALLCRFSELKKTDLGIELLAEVQLPTAILKQKDRQLPLKELSGTVQLKENSIAGKLQLFPETVPGRLRATFEHNISTAVGNCTLSTDRRLDLSEENIRLSNLLTSWKLPFNLESGKVSLKADASWNLENRLQLSAFVAVTGGSGYYKQFLFNGLDVRQDLAVLPDFYSKTEGSFSLQQLIGGIDVHNIHANVNFAATSSGKLPLIEIGDFSALLFDGSISSSDISYDPNLPDSDFVVAVENVNLEPLVNLVQMNSLYVSGRISGSIPVTIQGKDISVVNGELHNEMPGGEIRYTSTNMDHPGITGYAVKAVENLQYNSLKATAMYLPSGQLDLDIGLQGISPGLQTSRPVHLNIHAEQNLPALLQSLRFSKGLTEELDKRIKQHYN